MNSMWRLMAVGAITIAALGLAVPPAFAATSYTSYAPNGAGKTTYNTSNNHYQIYDTKGDHRAVAVLFYRPGGAFVGFQSCHEGAGDSCPGDLPGSVSGSLCMSTGVGLGSNPEDFEFGQGACFENA